MFVVRLTRPDGGLDFKAFGRKPDAVERFEAGNHMVWDNDLERAAIFEVRDVGDARTAVRAVQAGRADILDIDRKAGVEKAIGPLSI